MQGIQDGFLEEEDPGLRAGDGDKMKMWDGWGPRREKIYETVSAGGLTKAKG